MTTTLKTPREIADLKKDWEGDPCWDIEYTEGFEAHREELLNHRVATERRWAEQNEYEIARTAEIWGIPGNREFGLRIKVLLDRVSALEQKVNNR